MKRITSNIGLDDLMALMGLGLLCGGLAVVYWPAALMVAGGILLLVSVIKYLPPGGKGA